MVETRNISKFYSGINISRRCKRNVQRIVAVQLLLIPVMSGISSAQTANVWSGRVSHVDFNCLNRGVGELVIDGRVEIYPGNRQFNLTCPSLKFQNGGMLRVYGSANLSIEKLSGAMKVRTAWGWNVRKHSVLQTPPLKNDGADGAAGKHAPAPPNELVNLFPEALRLGLPGKPGQHGKVGRQGRNGAAGLAGRKGPSVVLRLGQAEPGSSVEVISIGQDGGDGQKGGVGTVGGKGGDGGRGGDGSHSNFVYIPGKGGAGGRAGRGGKGGAGGNGGRGGSGGNGGDIQLVYSGNTALDSAGLYVSLKSVGGRPGKPGLGGKGGQAGLGGKGGGPGIGGRAYPKKRIPKAHDGARGANGANGVLGRSGRTGQTGRYGQPGRVLRGNNYNNGGSEGGNELLSQRLETLVPSNTNTLMPKTEPVLPAVVQNEKLPVTENEIVVVEENKLPPLDEAAVIAVKENTLVPIDGVAVIEETELTLVPLDEGAVITLDADKLVPANDDVVLPAVAKKPAVVIEAESAETIQADALVPAKEEDTINKFRLEMLGKKK